MIGEADGFIVFVVDGDSGDNVVVDGVGIVSNSEGNQSVSKRQNLTKIKS